MTEFAIVAPILLLILMGIMQLGVVYNNWVTLTDAARAGARKAAVCRTGCSPDATTATTNAVKNSAANLNLAAVRYLFMPSYQLTTDERGVSWQKDDSS